MTLLCYDDIFLEHETGDHPESAERLQSTWRHLVDQGLDRQCERGTWKLATREQLTRIHDASYVDVIQQSAEQGGGRIEADTQMSMLSHHVASQASGAVCEAVEQVLGDKHQNALCLVRPPGHHARPRNAMGFCLYNHVAVGARHATEALGVERVLVVDWDVHHGNGTQESFYDAADVGFFSLHRSPFFPNTGKVEETGTGDGLGTTLNIPVEFGTPRDTILEQFARGLEHIAEKIRPQLILISAGFDAHRSDPIGSLGLEVEDFATLTRMVREQAETHCQGKMVSTLEGGYHPDVLPLCVAAHLDELLQPAVNAPPER